MYSASPLSVKKSEYWQGNIEQGEHELAAVTVSAFNQKPKILSEYKDKVIDKLGIAVENGKPAIVFIKLNSLFSSKFTLRKMSE